MTRHGMLHTLAADAQPSATVPRVPIVIIDADSAPPSGAPRRQHCAAAQQSGLSASITALPDGGRAIAHTGRNSKSP